MVGFDTLAATSSPLRSWCSRATHAAFHWHHVVLHRAGAASAAATATPASPPASPTPASTPTPTPAATATLTAAATSYYSHTYTHLRIYTSTDLHIYTHTHIHIYTYTHTHIYTYIHIYSYTYTLIHIYSCTYMFDAAVLQHPSPYLGGRRSHGPETLSPTPQYPHGDGVSEGLQNRLRLKNSALDLRLMT